MNVKTNRARRGSISVEYILLASLVALTVGLGGVFPQAFGDLLSRSSDNMSAPVTDVGGAAPATAPTGGGDDGLVAIDDGPEAPGDEPDPLADPGDGFGDDPWAAPPEDEGTTHGSGCNQGRGNGSEGCDPGNSNQGDPANSNDEVDGGRGNGRGPKK